MNNSSLVDTIEIAVENTYSDKEVIAIGAVSLGIFAGVNALINASAHKRRMKTDPAYAEKHRADKAHTEALRAASKNVAAAQKAFRKNPTATREASLLLKKSASEITNMEMGICPAIKSAYSGGKSPASGKSTSIDFKYGKDDNDVYVELVAARPVTDINKYLQMLYNTSNGVFKNSTEITITMTFARDDMDEDDEVDAQLKKVEAEVLSLANGVCGKINSYLSGFSELGTFRFIADKECDWDYDCMWCNLVYTEYKPKAYSKILSLLKTPHE